MGLRRLGLAHVAPSTLFPRGGRMWVLATHLWQAEPAPMQLRARGQRGSEGGTGSPAELGRGGSPHSAPPSLPLSLQGCVCTCACKETPYRHTLQHLEILLLAPRQTFSFQEDFHFCSCCDLVIGMSEQLHCGEDFMAFSGSFHFFRVAQRRLTL